MKTEAERNVRRNVVDVVDQLATSRSRRSPTTTNLMLMKTVRQQVPHVQYLEDFAHVRWKMTSSSSPIQRSCESRCAGFGDPAARRRAACEASSSSSVKAPNWAPAQGEGKRDAGERKESLQLVGGWCVSSPPGGSSLYRG